MKSTFQGYKDTHDILAIWMSVINHFAIVHINSAFYSCLHKISQVNESCMKESISNVTGWCYKMTYDDVNTSWILVQYALGDLNQDWESYHTRISHSPAPLIISLVIVYNNCVVTSVSVQEELCSQFFKTDWLLHTAPKLCCRRIIALQIHVSLVEVNKRNLCYLCFHQYHHLPHLTEL